MSDDVVTTVGRRMTVRLQDALDNLTGDRRRLAIRALGESESTHLGELHRALALELTLAALREDHILRALDPVEAYDDLPPCPPGAALFFDPDDAPGRGEA